MNRLCYGVCILALTVAAVACGDSREPAADFDTDGNAPPVAAATSGTTAQAEEAQAGATQADPATDLPDTASPLPWIAAVGGLSLGAAAGLRYLQRS